MTTITMTAISGNLAAASAGRRKQRSVELQVDEMKVESPSEACNGVIGCEGRRLSPQPGARGAYYQSHGQPVEPSSLYEEQPKLLLAPKDQSARK